eukprot:TRINITY_DN7479_c0_g1_i1.p1 TRINITY_DN7479_c0_g1~~TRINITY_DN7479_c0_g1_i1.p1  ORF type:complete len:426 (-),score=82.73 TRINITY_DN7479_c0_g1_i1:137-1414(-)
MELVKQTTEEVESSMDKVEELFQVADNTIETSMKSFHACLDVAESCLFDRIRELRASVIKSWDEKVSQATLKKTFLDRHHQKKVFNIHQLKLLQFLCEDAFKAASTVFIPKLNPILEIDVSRTGQIDGSILHPYYKALSKRLLSSSFPRIERQIGSSLPLKGTITPHEVPELRGTGLWGCAVHPQTGFIYLTANDSGKVLILTPDYKYHGLVSRMPETKWEFLCPRGITFTADGSHFAVVEYSRRVVQIFHGDGTHHREIGTSTASGGPMFDAPYNASFDLSKNLYVTDRTDGTIKKVSIDGELLQTSLPSSSGKKLGLDGIEVNFQNQVCVAPWKGPILVLDEEGNVSSENRVSCLSSSNNYLCRGFHGGLVVTDRSTNSFCLVDANFNEIYSGKANGTIIGAVVALNGDLLLVDRDGNRIFVY